MISELSSVVAGITAGLTSAASGNNSYTNVSNTKIGTNIAKNAVENNLLEGFRESFSYHVNEMMLPWIREFFGEDYKVFATIINGTIVPVHTTVDSTVSLADAIAGGSATIFTCSLGMDYCEKVGADFYNKVESAKASFIALKDGSAWEALKQFSRDVYDGKEEAVENLAAIAIGSATGAGAGAFFNNKTLKNFPENKNEFLNYPLGSRYNQMNQPKNPIYQPVRNKTEIINNREYSGHALDRMQDRGIMPSVIENTINKGIKNLGPNDTYIYFDRLNGIKVILNESGKVITVTYGK